MHQVQLAVAQMFDGVTEVLHVEPAAPLTRVLQLMVSLKSRSFRLSEPITNW